MDRNRNLTFTNDGYVSHTNRPGFINFATSNCSSNWNKYDTNPPLPRLIPQINVTPVIRAESIVSEVKNKLKLLIWLIII